ncbi:MAG: MoaD/ThiS family protein [Nitrososphaerota archaeon]
MRIILVGFLKKEFNKEFIEIKLDKPMELIKLLNKKIPRLSKLILIESKKLSSSFIFLKNGVSIDIMSEDKTILNNEDILTIIPVSHGG